MAAWRCRSHHSSRDGGSQGVEEQHHPGIARSAPKLPSDCPLVCCYRVSDSCSASQLEACGNLNWPLSVGFWL